MTPNRHIVDQLADVRAEKKRLEEREAELRAAISAAMGENDSLGGDEYIAMQKVSERRGALDEKKLAAAGIDPDKFRKSAVTVYSLVVERRVMEAAE